MHHGVQLLLLIHGMILPPSFAINMYKIEVETRQWSSYGTYGFGVELGGLNFILPYDSISYITNTFAT